MAAAVRSAAWRAMSRTATREPASAKRLQVAPPMPPPPPVTMTTLSRSPRIRSLPELSRPVRALPAQSSWLPDRRIQQYLAIMRDAHCKVNQYAAIFLHGDETTIGLDVGLNHFYTDSKGEVVENPRFLRKSERQLKKLQRKVSKRKKGSANRRKAVKRLARKHLQVSRQRKDFAVKTARCVVRSNDLIAYEDLQVRNMVKNHKLAKSISDASWSMFRNWVEYFGKVFGKVTIAVPPQYTSQNCSTCGTLVKKSLSERTHQCSHCGTVLDRDHNAALNILAIGLNRVGHTQISTPVESSTSAS